MDEKGLIDAVIGALISALEARLARRGDMVQTDASLLNLLREAREPEVAKAFDRPPSPPVEITEFLAFCPDVREALNKLHPLEAARRVQEISDDLDWGRVPEDQVDYSTWRDERNRQEASRPHKPHKR